MDTYNAMITQYMKTISASFSPSNYTTLYNDAVANAPATPKGVTGMTKMEFTYGNKNQPNIYSNWTQQPCHNVVRHAYDGLNYARQQTATNVTDHTAAPYGISQYPTTMLRPITNQSSVSNVQPSGLAEVYNAPRVYMEQNNFLNAIPTTNYIHSYETELVSGNNTRTNFADEGIQHENNYSNAAEEETEYPHLALDLSKIKNSYEKTEQKMKPKVYERQSIKPMKEVVPEVKILIGKPRYPYTAQFNDPVEKELEKWHNRHNTNIKWTRVKRGVYTANDQEVKLVKLNGGLYVKGASNNSKHDHLPIDKFVQMLQNGNLAH
ncbi:hypothetical protein BaOVIS_017780 [Babesia ovis]|uniref:Uncharacterized protein n=1 Tax=Babesia ovis TaxID=5869 RepID=A0A9W5WUZ9_BABOV|nr:hypothetical protein BaOVIS_017780 [Babesia ovis]